jgi:hypothetical protein
MQPPDEREKVRFRSGDTECVAWHYPGSNGACVVMAGGFAVTKEPGTDRFAGRFHQAGFTVLAFDYRHLGESGGRPRLVVRVGGQLADWRAAIAFTRSLPGVDPTRLAIWGFSLSGGHVLQVASCDPDLAAAIAQTPNADGPAAMRNAMRHTTAGALLRLTGRGLRDAFRGLLGRDPCWCRSPASPARSRSSPRPTRRTAPGRSTPTAGTRTGGRRSPPVRCCGSAATGRDGTPRASGARCWSSPATRIARPSPAPRSAPLGGLPAASSSACPVGTTSASWAGSSGPSRPSCRSCTAAWSTARRPGGRQPPRRSRRRSGGVAGLGAALAGCFRCLAAAARPVAARQQRAALGRDHRLAAEHAAGRRDGGRCRCIAHGTGSSSWPLTSR